MSTDSWRSRVPSALTSLGERTYLLNVFEQHLLATGRSAHSWRAAADLAVSAPRELEKLVEEYAKAHDLSHVVTDRGHDARCHVYASETLMVQLDVFRTEIMATADSAEALRGLKQLVKPILATRAPQRQIYVLMSTSQGYDFSPLGTGGVPLERDNYDAAVLAGYDTIVRDLESPAPSGRFAILEGATGSGKTYLVRGLIDACPDTTFAFVPADMLPQLSGPSLLQALVDGPRTYRRHRRRGSRKETRGPMVLVLEDADGTLLPRMNDNMSRISALLNFSDGLLGALLDLRIIATTNANLREVDSALLRPGRLSARLSVGPLSLGHARRVLTRLGAKDTEPTNTTLAWLYEQARGEEPVKAS